MALLLPRIAIAIAGLLAASATLHAAEPVEKDGYTLRWTAVNWQGGVTTRGGQMEWEASLTGRLSAPPGRQVVGYIVQVDEVLDVHGRSLLPTEFEKRWAAPRRPRNRENQVQRVLGRRSEGGELGNFTLPLGGGTEPAAKIAKVRGTLYVMEVTRTVELDVPLAGPTTSWREAEGVKVRVENIEQRGQQTAVSLGHTLTEQAAGGENLAQPPYVYAAVPIDERGREMPVHMASVSARGDGQLMVTIFSQTGQPARPASLRLLIAASTEERKITFGLSDVDLGLGPRPRQSPEGNARPEDAPADN
jgi:hypothetical protein